MQEALAVTWRPPQTHVLLVAHGMHSLRAPTAERRATMTPENERLAQRLALTLEEALSPWTDLLTQERVKFWSPETCRMMRGFHNIGRKEW